MAYTLKIGGELYQVNEGGDMSDKTKERFESAYGSIDLVQPFKDAKFLVNYKITDICFDKDTDRPRIIKALERRKSKIPVMLSLVRRLSDKKYERIIKSLDETLEHISVQRRCPSGKSIANIAKDEEEKLKRIARIVNPRIKTATDGTVSITNIGPLPENIKKIYSVLQEGGKHKSDLADPTNYLQTVFKFMYLLAHPNKLRAKKDWSKLLEQIQKISLEDILRGLQEHHESNSNATTTLLTEDQIQSRLKSILQLLQTHHYLEDSINLDEFSITNAKLNSSTHTFTNTLDASIKTKLDKALTPIWAHYEATYPSLYAFVESQESMPLYSLLYLQTQMEFDAPSDKIIRLDESEFNTKPFKTFLKNFNKDYKSAKPTNPLEQDRCLLLEGRNFRIPDTLEDTVETEVIDKLILKEGKRRHYKETLLKFLREFFSKKSVYIVYTKRTDEELNGLALNLETEDMDSAMFKTIYEQVPSLTLSQLGITVHQMPTDPVWTDTLNAFCAILAFKKELGSTSDGEGSGSGSGTETETTTKTTKATNAKARDHSKSVSFEG